MANRWTEKQLKAIRTNGCNILVAAAAGSGKTAVLVERIIRKNHGRRWHRRGQNGRCNLYKGGGGGNEAENP